MQEMIQMASELYLIALCLFLGPADQREIRIDQVGRHGLMDTVIVQRTDQGYAVYDERNGQRVPCVTLQCSEGQQGVFVAKEANGREEVKEELRLTALVSKWDESALAGRLGGVASGPVVTATGAQSPFDWRTVESTDYRQYIVNLRAIGCPEKTIRDIVGADLEDLFRERSRVQHASMPHPKYWEPGFGLNRQVTEEAVARRQELNRDKAEILRTLLGAEARVALPVAVRDELIVEAMKEALDFLPAEKLTALKEMQDRFSARVDQKARRTLTEHFSAEFEAALSALLSSEEKFEFDLRLSETADHLRRSLGSFQPTEQEFRALFPMRRAFEIEYRMWQASYRMWQASETEVDIDSQAQSVNREEIWHFTRQEPGNGLEADRIQLSWLSMGRIYELAAQQEWERCVQQVLGEARFREYQQVVGDQLK